MPPRVLARRAGAEARRVADRVLEARRIAALDGPAVLRALGAHDVDGLWRRLAERPYPFVDDPESAGRAVELDPGERERILAAADFALAHRIDLLGSGPVELGTPVDWRRDPKSGRRWPLEHGPSLDYAELGEPSDVKLPWEISRLQWLLPAGQAYLLTGEERYADGVRDVLEDWSRGNPCPLGPNWAIAMEPALRILAWTWLIRACRKSEAFRDPAFRLELVRQVFLHGRFVARNLELSDVNGNHADADATGLVFAGLFLGSGEEPRRWLRKGWAILLDELPRQVTPDGVDFEGSVPYHRLATELFLLPALYRECLGLEVPGAYLERLCEMAHFAAHVTRPDGTTPVVGDNDDARALPLGGQAVGDHRYMAAIAAAAWEDPGMLAVVSGPRSEAAWSAGPAAAGALPDRDALELPSRAFPDAGFYVLSGPGSHVLVDCGPVGQAGRGGHGHNDCLSFEAWLRGVPLIVDSGCFAYTGSVEWRNRLRATAAHSTPMIDGAEQNRLDPRFLWSLSPDAVPEVREWASSAERDRLVAAHSGYARLPSPVTPVRTVALEKATGMLAIHDRFEGAGVHELRAPLHLAPDTSAVEERPGRWRLENAGRSFALELEDPEDWGAELRPSWVAPRYGVKVESRCLELSRRGPIRPLLIVVGAPDAKRLLELGRSLVEDGAPR
jgi:hypothetical protein